MDGKALIYCERAFNTPNGKTAHGLVRRSHRYLPLGVIDSRYTGYDAGEVLDGKKNGIAVYESLEIALAAHPDATHFVVGLAPDGGRLDPAARLVVRQALESGLNVDSGLHDFISEDPEMREIARNQGVIIRDVRKTPAREQLHFFCGKIEEVRALKIALLGTDSAVGKRTTAWILVDALQRTGVKAELIGTGQTAWMQGARYSIILDSLINDFVSGEIEHAVWSAWQEEKPEVIIIEGQGSLLNPAYPGGFEILAAGRPDMVVLQHAPARKEYDGFPGYALHDLKKQIGAIQYISDRPVVAITINHENIAPEDIPEVCRQIEQEQGIPASDPLLDAGERVARQILNYLKSYQKKVGPFDENSRK